MGEIHVEGRQDVLVILYISVVFLSLVSLFPNVRFPFPLPTIMEREA
jgi:hypothetical protein